ncbi:hypothetical protein [Microbacterium panaciterrae]|uniref:Uncharacterized protein n=1 Tax=Microbacterium panaciterrae TaxID=985759 RepID=A0ABP8PL77_9MICO
MTDPTTPPGEPVPESVPDLAFPPVPELAPPLGPTAPPYAASAAQDPSWMPSAPVSHPASAAPTPPAPGGRGRFTIALALSGAVVLLLLIAVSVGAILLITRGSGTTAAPSSTTAPSAQPGTAPSTAPGTRPSAAPSIGSGSSPASAEVEAMLADMLARYKSSSQDGSLWQRIPDDEHNRVAVQAFLYLLTDMHSAFLWGVDDATAQKFKTDAETLEGKLLAQQPLGTSVKITGKNGTFTYDGDTGAGGWS